jgi:hypothetical protein
MPVHRNCGFSVARACKTITHAISKGALGDVLGCLGSENVQGEVQKKLDVIANKILLDANEWGGHLAAMALPKTIRHAAPCGLRMGDLSTRPNTPQP